MSSRLATLLAPSLLATVIATAPACGGDDPDPGPGGPDPLDEAALEAELEAWRGRVVKDCSLADAMPSLFRDNQKPSITPALDAARVRQLLGDGLWTRDASGKLVVLADPPAPSHTGFGGHTTTVRRNGEVIQDIRVGSVLDDTGTCVIRYDDQEVFRGRLWGQLPVAIHDVGESSHFGSRVVFASGASSGSAYVTLASLRGLVSGFEADLPVATAAIGKALGVDAGALRNLVVHGPGWFESVRAQDATAPSPIVARGGFGSPLTYSGDPTIPVSLPDLGRWTVDGTRTVLIQLPRTLSDGPAPVGVQVTVAMESGLPGSLDMRVVSVADPVPLAVGNAASTCLREVASSVLGYIAQPARQPGTTLPAYPTAVMIAPSVASEWMTAPCELFSTDIAADIRGDAQLLGSYAKLLDPGVYGWTKISPNSWGDLLARVAVDGNALASLETAAGSNALVTAAVRSQRALLADRRYADADDHDRERRRALFWHASILCGAELSAEVRESLLGVADADIGTTISSMSRCPGT